MADLGAVARASWNEWGDDATLVAGPALELGAVDVSLSGRILLALAPFSLEHRAEQCMKQVQNLVTGLTTTGANVDRGVASEIPADKLPALRVAVSDDPIVEPWSPQLLDSDLQVSIFAYAHDSAENIEQVLHRMRKEVNFALANVPTLGLDFVHSIVELGARKPNLVGDLAKPAGVMEFQYLVKYRRSRTDPSV